MSCSAFLMVAVGGALGALCRGVLTSFFKRSFKGLFPIPTLIVNLLACTGAGICAAIVLDHTLYLLLLVGFLGGFSTLATVNSEAVTLFASKHYKTCIAYLFTTYASTLLAAGLGFAIVSALL